MSDLKAKIEEAAGHFPSRRSAIMPALFLAQEQYGSITYDAMEEVADILGVPKVWILEIANFYTMYNKKPVGKFHIQVCTNLSCMLREADGIVARLEEQIGVKTGETTADGMFTLSAVECLGSCGTAPMMQVNKTYYEDLTVEGIDEILKELREKAGNGGDRRRHDANGGDRD